MGFSLYTQTDHLHADHGDMSYANLALAAGVPAPQTAQVHHQLMQAPPRIHRVPTTVSRGL